MTRGGCQTYGIHDKKNYANLELKVHNIHDIGSLLELFEI